MAYDPPIVVYDANVLYPFHLRNLLIQCAVDRLVAARWTDEIHEEWIRALTANVATLDRDRLLRTRDLMNRALPEANVTGYARHLPGITLPDPNDRHVVAAAVECGASLIVTWNTKDFPARGLRPHGLRKQSPDAFLLALREAAPDAMIEAARNARRNLTKSCRTASEFIEALRRQKVVRFAKVLGEHSAEI
jgi:hypothetical protein